MSAGTAYSKRFGAGFVDKPTLTTPIDSAFLNAVEAALLQLIGSAPTADGQVAQWDNVNTRYGPALLLNKNIDPAAAIVKSKLDFSGGNGIVNADVAGAAAISRSKLDFGAGLVNADVATTAAIAISKLALGLAPATTLPGSPTDGQLAVLTDSVTVPTYSWLFTWSASAAKWYFIGGNPVVATPVSTAETSASTTFVDLATVGPAFTVPRAGVYEAYAAARLMNNTGTNDAYIGVKFGSNATGDLCSIANVTASVHMSTSGVVRGAAVAASDVIKMQYRVGGAGTGTWTQRTMMVTPVYVT